MYMNRMYIAIKTLFALLGTSAVVTELAVLLERNQFVAGNFFSYFTIQSNMLAVLSLLVGAFSLAAGYKSKRVDYFRGAVALYMVMTGVIFSVLLANLDSRVLTAVPWDNTVLHYIIPVVMLADWIVDPPSSKLNLKGALLWLVYPLAYVIYTLVRGSIVGWYPYPFLNPDTNGYAGIGIVSIAIFVAVLVFTWLLIKLPVKRRLSR